MTYVVCSDLRHSSRGLRQPHVPFLQERPGFAPGFEVRVAITAEEIQAVALAPLL